MVDPVVYTRVVRYGRLLTPAETKPFFDDYYETGNETSLHALADHFEEAAGDDGDSRSDVLRRHLGVTKYPATDDEVADGWPESYGHLPHTHAYSHGEVGPPEAADARVAIGESTTPGGRHTLTFRPVARERRGKAEAVNVDYWHTSTPTGGRIQTRAVSGAFTSAEARGLADKLPPEHAATVHAMLDHHFGSRR